jgi:hypothetical protein
MDIIFYYQNARNQLRQGKPQLTVNSDSLICFFASLRAEVGKNIHFPARGSASEALAAFYQKI